MANQNIFNFDPQTKTAQPGTGWQDLADMYRKVSASHDLGQAVGIALRKADTLFKQTCGDETYAQQARQFADAVIPPLSPSERSDFDRGVGKHVPGVAIRQGAEL